MHRLRSTTRLRVGTLASPQPSRRTSSDRLDAGPDRLLRGECVLQLRRVLVRERGFEDRPAVLLQSRDRLVRRRFLDDHEQGGRPRLEVIANLLLERVVNRVFSQVAEQRAETRAHRPAGEWNEEEQAEQQSPEATPNRSAGGGGAAVARGGVQLSGLVT